MELRVVAFLLRYQPYIAAPPELGREISRFLGPSSNLALSEACVYSSTALLDWIWESSCSSIAERLQRWSLNNFLRCDNHYYKWQFAKGMEFVARDGNMDILEWFFKHFQGCVVSVDIVELAAENGHLDVLIYLQEHAVARECYSEAPVNWTGPGHCVCWEGHSLHRACRNGHGHVVRWLLEYRPHGLTVRMKETLIRAALNAGLVGLAQFFLPAARHIADYVNEYSHPQALEVAITSGHLTLNQNSAVVAIRNLAKAGRLDLIKRVPETIPWFDRVLVSGDCLCQWRLAIQEAIRRSDMHMIRWFLKHPIGQALLAEAKMMKYSLGFASAAANTAILQYLNDEDLLADDYEDGLVHAVHNGRLEAVKWLLSHVTNFPKLKQYNLMDVAAKLGYLDILQFFHGSTLSKERGGLRQIRLKGCSTEAMDYAAANGHLEVVQWLHMNRSEGCTTKAMNSAAKEGHLEVVKWLYRNRSEGCTFKALEKAIGHGQLRVACWLRTHYPEHVPAMVGKHICSERALEILLFLHVNHPHVVTMRFCANMKRDDNSGSCLFVSEWMEAHCSDD
ncbi:hypothetical protein V7S43_017436 [Phytophthora oleae]|uniref:Ankyrin repeat-containing domain n=1 Tax=Phytophthora oleae TaxID=2107226 RepID=A0ABD3ET83_9STRA